MAKPEAQVMTYYYRGLVERGTRWFGFRWAEGFSANGESGGPLYPWLTKPEARLEAKSQGLRAVFIRSSESQPAPATGPGKSDGGPQDG